MTAWRNPVSMGRVYTAPAVLIVLLLFLYPLAFAGWMSLHDWPLVGLTQEFIGTENYTSIPDNQLFVKAITYTVVYTVFTTIAVFAVGLALALLAQGQRHGAVFFRSMWFLPYVIGFGAAGLLWWALYNDSVGPFTAILNELGLVSGAADFFGTQFKGTASVIVMVTWKTTGFIMLVLIVALHAIPPEYYEAARIDGATPRQQFRFITVPLLRPTIALLSVISITGSLLAFDQFYIMTRGGPSSSTVTMVFAMYREGFVVFKLGSAAAMAMLLLLALLILNGVQIRILRGKVD